MNYYCGEFAGKRLDFAFRHPDTARYFRGFLKPSEASEDCVRIPYSDCAEWIRDYGMLDDGNTEFGRSIYVASDELVKYDRFVLHAAAMLWHGKALLFSADSGTGKSTQLRHWMSLYGDEIQIMNGDKPILRRESDGSFTVHPSPWKGKEEWGDDSLIAPLGGIILLRQSQNNRIARKKPMEIAPLLLTQFFSSFDSTENIHLFCRMEDALLSSVPVWLLENLGDEASAALTHNTLGEAWNHGL